MEFPLPLTAFEEYLLLEDCPSFPFSMLTRMHFSGRIRRSALEAAIQVVLPRHPLLTARVGRSGRRGFHWESMQGAQPAIQWEEGPLPSNFPQVPYLDIRKEIGLRLQVITDGRESDLILQFHHVACDALAAAVFFNELLVAYAQSMGAQSEKMQLPDLNTEKLLHRGKSGLTGMKRFQTILRQIPGILALLCILNRKVHPIIPHRPISRIDPPQDRHPCTIHHGFGLEETFALRSVARRSGVEVNELIMRDLLNAIGDFRREHLWNADDDDWQRLMTPVSLRSRSDRDVPATNMVSTILIDRRGRSLRNRDRLLKLIHKDMEMVKRFRLGYTFVLLLKLFRYTPGGLSWIARSEGLLSSVFFANLGRLFARSPLPKSEGRLISGNLTLERIEIVSPLRPKNCVSVAASFYAGRLGLTLHYDSRVLSEEQAGNLFYRFLNCLKESASTDP